MILVDMKISEPKSITELLNQTRNRGFLYIATAEGYCDNYFKVGFTQKTIQMRMKELSSNLCAPNPFHCLQSYKVMNCKDLESVVHEKLKQFRKGHEFFQCPIETIEQCITDTIIELNVGIAEQSKAA